MVATDRKFSQKALVWLIGASAVGWSIALLGTGARSFEGNSAGTSWTGLVHREDLSPFWSWSGTWDLPALAEGPLRWLLPMAMIGCASAATGVLAILTAREAGQVAGVCAGGAFLLTGYFGPAGGEFALIDAPGWLFWFLTLDRLSLAMASPPGERRPWRALAMAGAGAWIFQAHAMLLLAGIGLGLALRKPMRLGTRLAFVVGFWLALLGGLFLFQGGTFPPSRLGIGAAGREWTWNSFRLVEILHTQAFQLFPWFWLALLYGLLRGWWRWIWRGSSEIADCGFRIADSKAPRPTGTTAGRRPADFLLRGAAKPLDSSLGLPGNEALLLGVATVTWGLLTLGALTRPVLPQWGLIGLATMLPTLGRDWASALARRPGLIFRGRLALYSAVTLVALTFSILHAQDGGWLAPSTPGRLTEHSLEASGFRWNYTVYAPSSYDGRQPWPVIFLFHGSSHGGHNFLNQAHWMSKAEEGHFLVVAPDGRPLQPWRAPHAVFNPRVWNSGQHKPGHPRRRIDDLAFIEALLDDVADQWRIDPERLYAAGHSSGGALTFRLAAERAERFAAIASVSGTCYVIDPRPSHPVPTLFVQGSKDVILTPSGGLAILPWEIRRTEPIHESLTRWSKALEGWAVPCAFEVYDDPPRVIKHFGPHPEDRRMTIVLIEGQGHAWPGSTGLQAERLLSPTLAPIESIQATDLIWEFFQNRQRSPMLGLRVDDSTRLE